MSEEEEEARRWVRERFGVSRETLLADFAAMLLEEAERQNLMARSTWPHIWQRHLRDSAQLLLLAPQGTGRWIDIGSGAGLPGMVVAILSDWEVTLVEPRPLRTAFLQRSVDSLGLCEQVTVLTSTAERLRGVTGDVISARAVANLNRLFQIGSHLATPQTCWILPKGRSAQSEVEVVRERWQGSFAVVPSITQDDAFIVTATGIRPR